MDDERDVEVFERIPWESLQTKPDRRWTVYLASGVLVLGAIGVSVGRQMSAPTPPAMSTPSVPAATTVAVPPPVTEPPPTSTTAPLWSEADLMALPAATLEIPALARAEWFVSDYFTRDGEEERSFVEWVRAESIEWVAESTAEVSVLVRRLAASGDDPYTRLPTELWLVTMELSDEGWEVAAGPRAGAPPQVADAPDRDEEWTDDAGLTWAVAGSDT